MTSTGRWAVSNAGLYSDRPNQSFTSFSSSQFSNTLDSQLFQTAQISAGSLRYYGLGLENGNYTVNLQFAELEILNPPTWRSLGRRVFDVYVQGIRELKDFDIKKEAGGRSLTAVKKQFKARVSENHLEIHLFWAGKGTCCVPIQGTYGPSISAISATPDFVPTVSDQPPTTKKNRTGLIVGIVVGVGVLSLISLSAVYYLIQKRKQQKTLEDEDLKPKISDFGLAKLYDDKQTHINTRVAGTIGYLAPEYAMLGHLTEKADVFGFGVVALEIVSGRPNSDKSLEENKIYLLEWAWQLHENKRETELVDAKLSEFDVDEVKKVIGIALLCTQTSPGLRPSMSRVIAMLTGDAEVATVTSRPGYLTDWKFKDTTTFMAVHSSQMHNSSVGTSTAATTNYSPSTPETSMLSDFIGEGGR